MRASIDVRYLPPGMVMEVDEMVDAALALGELVTISSLPDIQEWEVLNAMWLKLSPPLSQRQPAARYIVGETHFFE